MRKSILLIISVLWVANAALAQQYFPTQQEVFGKNRIQNTQFNWKMITTPNFEMYFYQKNPSVANLVAQIAESEFDKITEIIGYTPFKRTRLFLYNSLDELHQSNVGLVAENTEISNNIPEKNRIEIAYSSNVFEFQQQLNKRITQIFLYEMMFGSKNIKQSMQNSLLLNLPTWFTDGLIAYITNGWSAKMDAFMRNIASKNKLKRPNLYTGKEAIWVGQSLWNYIAERYGKDNISNILNLTRMIHNEQTAIGSSLGISFNRMLKEWKDFYININQKIIQEASPLAGVALLENKTHDIRQVRMSNDRQWIAYTSNTNGKWKIGLINTASKKTTFILSGGMLQSSQSAEAMSLPLVAWQRTNTLSIVTEHGGKTYLHQLTIDDKTGERFLPKKLLENIRQIHSFDISDDGTSLALSADYNGKSDVLLYRIAGKVLTPLTNDIFDDVSPTFWGSSNSRVVFVSNRPTDSLRTTKKYTFKNAKPVFSLYLHDGNPRAEIVQLLADSLGNISHPIATNSQQIFFMSDAKGEKNLYSYHTQDSSLYAISNFKEHILDYDLIWGSFVGVVFDGSKENIIFQEKINTNEVIEPTIAYRIDKSRAGIALVEKTIENPTQQNLPKTNKPVDTPVVINEPKSPLDLKKGEVDTDFYSFDLPSTIGKTVVVSEQSGGKIITNRTGKNAAKIVRRLGDVKVSSPIDFQNILLLKESRGEPIFDPMPMRSWGWKQQFTLTDLPENHEIKTGFFITPNLKSSDLFLEYNYLPHRIDFGLRIDRKNLNTDDGFLTLVQRYRYNKVALQASYPVNNYLRLQVSPSYQTTRMIDIANATSADYFADYGSLRSEIIFDNTTTAELNLPEGLRAKIKFDTYTGLSNIADGFYKLSVDARYYRKIHRNLTLATRIAAGTSGGNSPKQAVLGGMDNWWGIRRESRGENDIFNQQTATGYNQSNMFFTDMVSPLRGFNFNKVSGLNYMVFNAEVRLPLVKYFYDGPVESSFFRNLQAVGFIDSGLAWDSGSPFGRRGSLSIDTFFSETNDPRKGKGSFNATVNNFKNPLLVGYGVGLRSVVFGYYLKSDLAWGVENGVLLPAQLYVTLGYDF